MSVSDLLAMTIATAMELTPLERARVLFMEAMEQHVIQPPNLRWRRRMEEYDRQMQRRKIRRVIQRHRERR